MKTWVHSAICLVLFASFVTAEGPASRSVNAEFYIGGSAVEHVGVYSLTGRKITVKQAIISAGLTVKIGEKPIYVTVLRRATGKDETLWKQVDLQDVFAGKHDDLEIQGDDLIQANTEKLKE
jgi:hypothetical protein